MLEVFFLQPLFLSLCLVQAYVKFNNKQDEPIIFPTFSFFEQQVDYFKVIGPAVELPINASSDGTNCAISYNLSPFDPNSTMIENITDPHTITFLDYSGSPCFFDTFANACTYFVQYREYLIKLGYPNPDTLVLIRILPYNDVAVGYPFRDYQAEYLKVVEDPPQPWLKLQMVDSDNSTISMRHIRDNINALFEVSQEMGAWNEAILSFWYRGTIWFLKTTMIIVLMFSLFSVYVSHLDGVLFMNLKFAIYLLGFIVSILHIATIFFGYFTLRNTISMVVQELSINWAFHLLLYLWSMVMSRLQHSSFILIFRGTIFFSLTIFTTVKVFNLVWFFNRRINVGIFWGLTITFLYPAVKFLLSISFLVVAIFFFRKLKTLGGSNNSTAEILKKFTVIATTGFLCYFVPALVGTSRVETDSNPTYTVLWILLYYIVNITQCIAILSIVMLKESSLIEREKSWLELRLSFIEEKVSSVLRTKRDKELTTL